MVPATRPAPLLGHTPKDEALIEARGLGRRAPGDGAWLLRDVSLALGPGERVGVAGPSGAGKSLLLRSIALLDPLDGGAVLWRGEPVADDRVPAFRRSAVYLHQRPALFEGPVEANLRRPFELAANRDLRYDRDGIVDRLERLGRGAGFLAKRTADLSGGEGQIVAFLRALQLEPEALLLDEPTSALDQGATAAIERLVDDWMEEGAGARGLLWVTHDRAQAERTTDRVLELRDGGLAG